MTLKNYNCKKIVHILIMTVILIIAGMGMAIQAANAATNPSGIPKKGDKYTGTATATKGWELNGNRNAGAILKNDGKFGGHVKTTKAYCIDRQKYMPHKGYKYKYTAKVTSVKNNKTGVAVSGYIRYIPTKAPKAGSPSKTQRLQCNKWSFTLKASPKLQLKKVTTSKCENFTKNNSNYSLAGTTYGLYKDKGCKDKKGTFKIKKNGMSNTLNVEKGKTYYVKEIKAGKGYKVDKTVHKVKNTKYNTVKKFTVADEAIGDPLELSLQKYDCRSGESKIPEDGSLKGAEFTLTYKHDGKTEKWVFAAGKDGRIQLERKWAKSYLVQSKSSKLHEDANGVCFPLGTYTLEETQEPLGYRKSDDKRTITISQIPGMNKSKVTMTPTDDGFKNIKIDEYAARGDFKLHKVEKKKEMTTYCDTCDENISGLSEEERAEKHGTTYYCPECGIDKTATHDKETIEKHMTEKHPDKNTEEVKQDTNPEATETKTDNKEEAKKETAAQSKQNEKAEVKTEKSESVQENSKEDQENKEEAKDSTDESGKDGNVKEDGQDETKDDENKDETETVKYKTMTGLRTRMIDAGKDPVENPLANVVFKLTNTETGESHEIKTDENGNYDSKNDENLWFGKEEKKENLGKLEKGTYKLEEQECDANQGMILAAPKIFVIEKDGAYIDLGTIINSNPLIQTTALDKNTGDHIAYGKKTITIVDTVKYKNLRPGHTYTLNGTLMDKETGKAFLDKNGNKVTASTTFTTKTIEDGFTDEDKSGSIQLPFTFEIAGDSFGKKLVAFEDMKEDGHKFAVHADLEDQEQTVIIPKIGTEAIGKDSETNLINNSGMQTINDTVKYEGLLAGKSYTMTGYAVDSKTGKEIEGTKNSIQFSADKESGSVVVPITIDAAKHAGSDVVIFEELYYNGKIVADHTDLKDSKQTVHISEIKTKAVDKDTKLNIIKKSGAQNIVDTVTYKNLIAGKTYTGKAWLVDPETGDKIEGTEVTKEFTAEEANGTFDMELTFTQDENEPLEKVTVFEEVYLGDKLIGEHKDVTDTDQTLSDIKIKTKAEAEDTKTNETSGIGKKKIIDTVHVSGLVTGDQYEVRGWLTDSEGKKLEGTDGTQKFEAKASEMDVKVELTFDASKYAGEDVHVFEELYRQNILIGEHKDTGDEDQVVHVSKVDTSAVSATWGNTIVPTKGKQYINDSVVYDNLDTDSTYTLKSWAVDKETGKKIEGSDATKTFTPEAPQEETAENETADTEDENIADKNEENKDEVDSEDTEDNEDIEDSEDGDMDEDEDEDVDDNEDSDEADDNEDEDTPSDEDKDETTKENNHVRTSGTVETTLPVKGEDVRGKHIVVFQEIYDKDGNLIGEHKDINSSDQSVFGPEIGTKAKVAGGLSQLVQGEGKTVVKDTIAYKNLERRNKYQVISWLVDHNGKKISGTETKSTFTPESPNGVVTVKIPVDQSKLKDTKLVAFEEVRLDGKFVAEHKDVHDKNQTVTITTPNTGDMKKMLPWIILAIVAAGGIGTVVYKKKKAAKK